MQSRTDRIKKLVEHGLSQADAESFADDSIRTDGFLNRRECPKCNGPLSRKLDPRQAEPTPAGNWFNYWCSCGYVCDRAEDAADTDELLDLPLLEGKAADLLLEAINDSLTSVSRGLCPFCGQLLHERVKDAGAYRRSECSCGFTCSRFKNVEAS